MKKLIIVFALLCAVAPITAGGKSSGKIGLSSRGHSKRANQMGRVRSNTFTIKGHSFRKRHEDFALACGYLALVVVALPVISVGTYFLAQ